jgi:DNA-binding MarR family transcriptional regulator
MEKRNILLISQDTKQKILIYLRDGSLLTAPEFRKIVYNEYMLNLHNPKKIRKRGGYSYDNIYKHFKSLEAAGYISVAISEGSSDGKKKWTKKAYQITEAGKQAIEFYKRFINPAPQHVVLDIQQAGGIVGR